MAGGSKGYNIWKNTTFSNGENDYFFPKYFSIANQLGCNCFLGTFQTYNNSTAAE